MDLPALVILCYLVFFVLVGIYISSGNRSSADWAIGGGTLGVGMLAAGIAGTRIGGAGTYGVAGDVISEGIGHLWYGVNSFAALFLVGLFFAIPYRRLRLLALVRCSIFVLAHSGVSRFQVCVCRPNISSLTSSNPMSLPPL